MGWTGRSNATGWQRERPLDTRWTPGMPGVRSVVPWPPPPGPLGHRTAPLGVEAAAHGGPPRGGGTPAGAGHQRLGQSFLKQLAGPGPVAVLGAAGGTHHPHPGTEVPKQHRPGGLIQRRAGGDVEGDLDPGVGGVGVLASRTPGAAEAPLEFLIRDAWRGGHPPMVDHDACHRGAPGGRAPVVSGAGWLRATGRHGTARRTSLMVPGVSR